MGCTINISSACIFQSCEKIFNNGVFVNLYAEKALHQQHYNIFDSSCFARYSGLNK